MGPGEVDEPPAQWPRIVARQRIPRGPGTSRPGRRGRRAVGPVTADAVEPIHRPGPDGRIAATRPHVSPHRPTSPSHSSRSSEAVVSLVLSLLLAMLCLLPAVAKLSGHPRMRHSAEHFGIPWKQYRLIGVAELAAAAGVLAGLRWPPLGI